MLQKDVQAEMSELGHLLNQKSMKIDKIISFSYVSLSKRFADHSYFICCVCNDTFPKSSYLAAHKENSNCWSQFEPLNELKQKLFVCRMCDTFFMDFKACITHIVTELIVNGFTLPSHNLDVSQCITIIYVEQLHSPNMNNTINRMKKLLDGNKDPIFDEIDKLEEQINNEEIEATSLGEKVPIPKNKNPLLSVSMNEFRFKQKTFTAEEGSSNSSFTKFQQANKSLLSSVDKKKKIEAVKVKQKFKDRRSSIANGNPRKLSTSDVDKEMLEKEINGEVQIKQEVLEPEVSIEEQPMVIDTEAHAPIIKMNTNGIVYKRGPYKKRNSKTDLSMTNLDDSGKSSPSQVLPNTNASKKNVTKKVVTPKQQPKIVTSTSKITPPSRVSKRQRVPKRKFGIEDSIDSGDIPSEDENNYDEVTEVADNLPKVVIETEEDSNHSLSSRSSFGEVSEESGKQNGGRTLKDKAEAERARRMAETDMFMELRVLKVDGDNENLSKVLDSNEKRIKLLKWATKEVSSLEEVHNSLNKELHQHKAKNMKMKHQLEELKRPPLKLKIAHGKSSIV